MFQRESLQLYFVMGSTNCLKNPREVLTEAIKGGITMFQFREKGEESLVGKDKRNLATDLQAICQEHGIPFIVNDDVELALSIGADGVHIGQDDGDIETIRNLVGKKILGISTHNVEEAKAALKLGADYIGVGPMYETLTKKDIQRVRGPKVIEEIRAAGIHLPLVGIGGICSGRVKEIAQRGADGIAVISAISKAFSIEESARLLRQEFQTSQLKAYL